MIKREYLKGFAKIAFVLILFVTGLKQLSTGELWPLIHMVNLVFHEAGHVIFFFFGHFLYVLGGSLTEVLIPFLVTIHFLRQHDWLGVSVGAWWSSTAWLSVGIYISDAQERALPLITGDIESHDWHHLLSLLNILPYDNLIGSLAFTISILWLLSSLLAASKDRDILLILNQLR